MDHEASGCCSPTNGLGTQVRGGLGSPGVAQSPPRTFLARCLAALRTLPDGVREVIFGLPEP